MAIETFEFIDDLNAANPTATDNVSEGDDHLRGLKTTLKNTFPNVTGAINATETELNVIDMSSSGSTSGQVLTSNGTGTVATWQDAVANFASLTDTTVSASDPLSTTNPTAVGHLWSNTTSGEIFVCTDATTNDNLWINVGGGVGDIARALTSPTLNAPADVDAGVPVTYTITSTDVEDDKFVFDVQSTAFSLVSVSAGSATVVGNTIEITGFGGSTVDLVLTFSNSTTYNNRVKAIDSNGIYLDSPWSSTDSIIITIPPAWYGDRGIFAGGWMGSSSYSIIQYITISSTGSGQTFGNMSNSLERVTACSNGVRGLISGGQENSTGNAFNNIDYITISTPSNATDFGNLTSAKYECSSCSDGVTGIIAGGYDTSIHLNTLDYVTIATTGNASDFGDMIYSRTFSAAVSNGTRGVIAGRDNSDSGSIEYITIATAGNGTDFGDLSGPRYQIGGCDNGTRGIFAGGTGNSPGNTIDYITIATTGTAIDFGDLTASRPGTAGASNGTRGVFAGGGYSSPVCDSSDYITISTTGNASSFGSISCRALLAGCAGD